MTAHAAEGDMQVTVRTFDWMRWGLAVLLLGALTLSACATPPATGASTGLHDPSSDNTESVPYDAWFKDRPQ